MYHASTTGSVQPCTPHRAGTNWFLVTFPFWYSLCIGGLHLSHPTIHRTSAVQIATSITYVILQTLPTPDYRPALSLVSFTSNFSERLSTFTYSYQESCSLYPRCTPYFSVEHTVSPQSAVSNFSSGCSVEYTIHNLMRCVIYHYTATALLGSQRGNPVVVGDTVMLSE